MQRLFSGQKLLQRTKMYYQHTNLFIRPVILELLYMFLSTKNITTKYSSTKIKQTLHAVLIS